VAASPYGANMTDLMRHVEFFDQDKDGIITITESIKGNFPKKFILPVHCRIRLVCCVSGTLPCAFYRTAFIYDFGYRFYRDRM
jgi:hypothetical protein